MPDETSTESDVAPASAAAGTETALVPTADKASARSSIPFTRKDELLQLRESLRSRKLLTIEGIKDFAGDNRDVAQTAFSSLLAGYATYCIMNRVLPRSHANIVAPVISAMVAAYIERAVTAITRGERTETEVYRELHRFVKKASAEHVKKLDEKLRAKIESIDHALDRHFSGAESKLDNQQAWNLLEHRQLVLLAIPRMARVNLAHWRKGDDPEIERTITEYTRDLVQTLPKEQGQFVEKLVSEWRHASVDEEPQRVQVALLGPPGVGKTRLIDLIRTQIFEKAGVTIPAITVDAGSGDYVFKLRNLYSTPQDALDESIEKFQLAYLQHGVANALVELDEGAIYLTKNHLHRLNTLKLLDRDKKTLLIQVHDVTVPFDSALLIFTGNQRLDELDEAMRNRVQVTELPPLKREERIEAMEKAINQRLAGMESMNFTQDQKDEIKGQIDGLKNFILNEDVKVNQGAREIQVVAKHAVQYLIQKMREGVAFDEESAKQAIRSSFTESAKLAQQSQPRNAPHRDDMDEMDDLSDREDLTHRSGPERVTNPPPVPLPVGFPVPVPIDIEQVVHNRRLGTAFFANHIVNLARQPQHREDTLSSNLQSAFATAPPEVSLNLRLIGEDERGTVLDAIPSQGNIRHLKLTASGNPVDLPKLFATLDRLDQNTQLVDICLHADDCQLNDSHAERLVQLKKLKELYASGNNITSRGAAALRDHTPSLIIHLNRNQMDREEALEMEASSQGKVLASVGEVMTRRRNAPSREAQRQRTTSAERSGPHQSPSIS
jgi:DNA replication protein DnaC